MNVRHDHTTEVFVSLPWSGGHSKTSHKNTKPNSVLVHFLKKGRGENHISQRDKATHTRISHGTKLGGTLARKTETFSTIAQETKPVPSYIPYKELRFFPLHIPQGTQPDPLIAQPQSVLRRN